MSDNCKYCGAPKMFDDENIDGEYVRFACGSEYYAEDGNWAQMRACCEAEEKAKQEPPTECQWCGAGVRSNTPSATYYACNSSWWYSETAWELSQKCMARCAEQLLKIRKGKR